MKRALLLAAAIATAAPAVPAIAAPHGHGYGRHHGHGWARGQVLPPQYRTRGYIVRDYHRYRLRPPPRGYHYVRNGDDVLLAAVASGIIAAVLADAIDGGYRGSYYEEEVVYGPGRPYGRGRSGYGGSGVIQGPGGQAVYSQGAGGGSYTVQGPGGQTIVTDGPNGRTIVRQGPGGQTVETIPYD